jgi:branched-chain amino acid transport system substrate-binding protein
MRVLSLSFVVATFALIGEASAATIGVVAPQSGPYAILGEQLRHGAKAALQKAGHEVLEIHETCAPDSGPAIAEALVNGKASFAIGFLCSDSLESSIEFLAASNIPVLTLSSRATGLIEDASKYDWPLYRLAPSLNDEATAASDAIIAHWKGMPIALIDDGTIYSRELTDSIRLRLENLGLKPSFVDTIRPGQDNQLALVRRLARLNIAHLFVAADRNDVAIIGRDALNEKIALAVMSGEAMKAPNNPVATPIGTLAVIEPDPRQLPSAVQISQELEAAGLHVEGYILPAYGAAQIADIAVKRSSGEQKPIRDILSTSSFDTILGAIRFNEQKGLSGNPFKLQEWNGENFVDPPQP